MRLLAVALDGVGADLEIAGHVAAKPGGVDNRAADAVVHLAERVHRRNRRLALGRPPGLQLLVELGAEAGALEHGLRDLVEPVLFLGAVRAGLEREHLHARRGHRVSGGGAGRSEPDDDDVGLSLAAAHDPDSGRG